MFERGLYVPDSVSVKHTMCVYIYALNFKLSSQILL